jgi:hypothetical protein
MILNKTSIGKYVAEELSAYGYECRCDVGVSDFKIDVAVVDPKNKHNFILAVLCDGTEKFSVKDRSVMQVQTLKRNNWNVIRLYALNFFNNPKREIKKIKEYLDKLTSNTKAVVINYRRPYRYAKYVAEKQLDAQAVLSGENDAELVRALKAVVAAEEPISYQFLLKRTLSLFGMNKYGAKIENKLKPMIEGCGFSAKKELGNIYYYKSEKTIGYERYRVESGTPLRVTDTDYTPFEMVSLIRGILLNKVSLYYDELVAAILKELGLARAGEKLLAMIGSCVDLGVYEGLLVRSIADRISLA